MPSADTPRLPQPGHRPDPRSGSTPSSGEFEAAERVLRGSTPTTRRFRQPRRNAPRAGHPDHNEARSRLLMALVWLRVDPTSEAPRLRLRPAPAERPAQRPRSWSEVLDALDSFPFDRPARDRRKLRSAAEVMAAFPLVRLIIDAKEQRINLSLGFAVQKPYDAGQQKGDMLKTPGPGTK